MGGLPRSSFARITDLPDMTIVSVDHETIANCFLVVTTHVSCPSYYGNLNIKLGIRINRNHFFSKTSSSLYQYKFILLPYDKVCHFDMSKKCIESLK